MKIRFNLSILVFSITVVTQAQPSNALIGGRAMGLGFASACLQDEWGIFNNVAGIAKITQTTASFTYEAKPALRAFNRMAALLAIPSSFFTAGFGAYRFGDDVYNEQLLSGGIANKLGLASLGLKINYIQYHAEGFGNARALSLSLGGIAQLTEVLAVGAHIVNINQPVINKITGERLPTVLVAGLALTPSEKIILTTEVEKDLDYEVLVKSGVEYKFHKKFTARTGLNLQPESAFLGFGWKTKKFYMDYAVQYNSFLGTIHQATVTYSFTYKK